MLLVKRAHVADRVEDVVDAEFALDIIQVAFEVVFLVVALGKKRTLQTGLDRQRFFVEEVLRLDEAHEVPAAVALRQHRVVHQVVHVALRLALAHSQDELHIDHLRIHAAEEVPEQVRDLLREALRVLVQVVDAEREVRNANQLQNARRKQLVVVELQVALVRVQRYHFVQELDAHVLETVVAVPLLPRTRLAGAAQKKLARAEHTALALAQLLLLDELDHAARGAENLLLDVLLVDHQIVAEQLQLDHRLHQILLNRAHLLVEPLLHLAVVDVEDELVDRDVLLADPTDLEVLLRLDFEHPVFPRHNLRVEVEPKQLLQILVLLVQVVRQIILQIQNPDFVLVKRQTQQTVLLLLETNRLLRNEQSLALRNQFHKIVQNKSPDRRKHVQIQTLLRVLVLARVKILRERPTQNHDVLKQMQILQIFRTVEKKHLVAAAYVTLLLDQVYY